MKQISLLFIISACIGYILHSTITSFIVWFIISSLVQVFAYNLYNKWILLKIEKLKNDRIASYESQGIETQCPCSKKIKHFIPFFTIDKPVRCADCNHPFKVTLDAETILITNTPNIDEIDKDFVAAYKKVLEKSN